MESRIDVKRRMPGEWLLRIAPRVFDESVLTSVVHQTIADLRAEWFEAGSSLARRFRARSLGYFAFWSLVVIAPFAFRKWPGRKIDKRVFWQMRGSSDMVFIRRFRFVAVLFILGLGAGYWVARTRPVLYTSSAVVQVIPSQISAAILDTTKLAPAGTVADGLRATTESILRRTRLERLIQEFNLFQAEHESMSMEEVVALMRRRITLSPSELTPSDSHPKIVISYTGSDPITVMKVVQRLTASLVDESLQDKRRRAEGTAAFVESALEDTEHQLTAAIERERKERGASVPRRLEIETLETTYKTLLTRRIEAAMQVDLGRRMMAEQLVVVDAAQVPQTPIGPTRLQVTLMGGAAGLATAALIALAVSLRRMLRTRRDDLAPATS
jgi:uncharacterized protein involved in exopolysaccharide biosynthesis